MSAESQNPNFYWGVANASFQVEGQPAPSDWSEWVAKPNSVWDGSNANKATGFWEKPEKDFELAKELGANMFRVSIAWERVNPARGQFDEAALDRYEQMILEMRSRGLEPLVTLQHFVLPAWIAREGGLLSAKFAEDFTAYALKTVKRLASGPARVKWWMTFNEPLVLTFGGYVIAEFPPNQKNNHRDAMRATANMARAHLKAMQALRDPAAGLPKDLQFSVASHLRDFQSPKWLPLMARLSAWMFNWQFLNAVTTGKLFFWMPGSEIIRENVGLPKQGTSVDYLGLNYYGRMMISLSFKPPFLLVTEGPGTKSDLGWEIYPEGMGRVLKAMYRRYKLPVMVSENGLADQKDALRSEFLRGHVEQLRNVVKAGVPVLGYLHWSLTDNFEWARGLTPRFGLVEVDYATGQLKPRPSFKVYQELIKRGL